MAAVILMAEVSSAAPLTLPDAIDRAVRFAPSMEAAAAERDMTSAQVREQRAPLFPNISTGGEYYQAPGYDDVVTNRGLSAAMVMATYTAWDWGRRVAKWRAARYVAEAARLGVAAAQAQIAYDTTVAYEELYRAHQSSDELRTSLARLDRYVATIEALGKSGRANASDVLKVRTARDAVEIALEQQRVATQRAAGNLGSLIGEFNQPDLEIANLDGAPPKPAIDI